MQGTEKGKRDNFIGFKKLDQALSRWAKEMKKSDGMITANMAKQKAEELSSAMGHDLKPSKAWLYKWKDRENIKFAKRTKDPDEILKEFLGKKESEQIKMVNGEKYDELKRDTKKQISNSLKDEVLEKEISQNHSQQCNETESENKQRTKRDYVKRLPIIDASGVICRIRKEKTFLTLLQKLEILQRLKNGERRPDLIIEYNLSHSAMSQIVTDEKRILQLAAGGQNLMMKRIRGGIFKNGEAELNAWVQKKMENGQSLTRTQIKNRAKKIAERLNIDFKASTGWLEKWKARMNLDFNEDQKLQRKLPKYMTTDEEFENNQVQFDQSESFYDQQDSEKLETEIKEEQLEDDYCDGMEINDDIIYNGFDATDAKKNLVTPQQFYLQTIQRSHGQAPQICNVTHTENHQTEEQLKPEELDTRFFISKSPHTLDSEKTVRPLETLHQQVLHWLSRYNISPVASLELLHILQPHLSSAVKKLSNTVHQNRNAF